MFLSTRRDWLRSAAAGLICPWPGRAVAEAGTPCDLLIRGGRIVDGTGNPWFHGDLAITGNKIAAVGRAVAVKATRTIDATGHVVAVIPET